MTEKQWSRLALIIVWLGIAVALTILVMSCSAGPGDPKTTTADANIECEVFRAMHSGDIRKRCVDHDYNVVCYISYKALACVALGDGDER